MAGGRALVAAAVTDGSISKVEFAPTLMLASVLTPVLVPVPAPVAASAPSATRVDREELEVEVGSSKVELGEAEVEAGSSKVGLGEAEVDVGSSEVGLGSSEVEVGSGLHVSDSDAASYSTYVFSDVLVSRRVREKVIVLYPPGSCQQRSLKCSSPQTRPRMQQPPSVQYSLPSQ